MPRQTLPASGRRSCVARLIRDELVFDAGICQRAFECGVVLRRDVLIGACLQSENRRRDLTGALDRVLRPAVEPDRARKTVTVRRGEPGMTTAEAETDGEDRLEPS